ncbi:phospholipid carrier-dependent glycosyltransferase [Chitinimonas sp.]|uniref:phospholipid carrier-dependent glycosyltransferase n=1 Tax=Chitinimonas sp. TaxID=1934313 RepID=UPI002F926663
MLERSQSLRRDLLLLLVLLLPWFLLLTGVRPLSVPDEGRYPEIAREMLLSGDFITPRINGAVFLDKPALYYWLQAVSMQFFGVSATSIRLMPALFGVAGCLAVFAAGWRWFGRRAAWLSALVLASSPLYFMASQYANLDLEVATWIALSLLAFMVGRQATDPARRRAWLWAAYLAGGLGALTKGLIGFVLPALVIFAWMLWRRRWRELPSWQLYWLPLAVLLVCLPWYAAVQWYNPQFLHFFFVYQQFQRYTGGGFNNAFPAWFYLAVLALTLLPWSFWLPGALRHGWQNRHVGNETYALLFAWPLAILLFFSLPASKIVSYILPVTFPLALLLGARLDARWREGKPGGWLALASGILLAALGVAALVAAGMHKPKLPPGWLLAGMGATLLLAAALCAWGWRRGMAATVLGLALGGAGLAGWLLPAIPYMERNSAQAAAEVLKPMLGPDAVLVSYRNYFQDLPLYLNRRELIRVVDDWQDPEIVKTDNWRREFYFALRDQPEAREWLLDAAAFKALLAGPRSVYVIARRDNEAELMQLGLQRYWQEGDLQIYVRPDHALK